MSSNIHAAHCDVCGKLVEPGDGAVIGGKSSDGWTVRHNSCSPVVDVDAMLRPWIKNQEYDL